MSFRTYALQFGVAALAVVVCLWTATQWAAAMLGHQAALGPAWIDAVGLKIYAPWQLFVWWLAFDAQAPEPPTPKAGVRWTGRVQIEIRSRANFNHAFGS